jgi:hypothetical protein
MAVAPILPTHETYYLTKKEERLMARIGSQQDKDRFGYLIAQKKGFSGNVVIAGVHYRKRHNGMVGLAGGAITKTPNYTELASGVSPEAKNAVGRQFIQEKKKYEFKESVKQKKDQMNWYQTRDPFQNQLLQNTIMRLHNTNGEWNTSTPISNNLSKDNFEYTGNDPRKREEHISSFAPMFLFKQRQYKPNTIVSQNILSEKTANFDLETNPKIVHIPRNHFLLFFNV